jgi:hypothetical protein
MRSAYSLGSGSTLFATEQLLSFSQQGILRLANLFQREAAADHQRRTLHLH